MIWSRCNLPHITRRVSSSTLRARCSCSEATERTSRPLSSLDGWKRPLSTRTDPRNFREPQRGNQVKGRVLDVTPDGPDRRPKFLSQDHPYFALDDLWNENKYYWNEEDYDVWVTEKLDDSLLYDKDGKLKVYYTEDDLKPKPPDWIRTEEEEEGIFPVAAYGEMPESGRDDGWTDMNDKSADPSEESKQGSESIWTQAKKNDAMIAERLSLGPLNEKVDPEENFFSKQNDIFEWLKKDEPDVIEKEDPAQKEFRKMAWPLAENLGSGGPEDFIAAMHEHPTDYAKVSFNAIHPNSKREPMPLFSRSKYDVENPPKEFVELFKRFLFVTGLPPPIVDGRLGDINNPIHRSLLEKTVAGLVRVDSSQVFAANSNSAFVGFNSPRALANILKEGPTERFQTLLPIVWKYDPDFFVEMEPSLNDFVEKAESPDCIFHLTNLPVGYTPTMMAKLLFPDASELKKVYGQPDPDDLHFLSENSLLVRLTSADKVESILESSLFQARLKEIGTYKVCFLRARRELKHWRFHPVDKQEELRAYGLRLIVDGVNMPSKQFYISHASALQVRNLDPKVMTKDYLTMFFQKFSQRRRTKSSIEFVTCELSGQPILGMAYIGFEEPHEASACLQTFEEGQVEIGDRTAQLHILIDRKIPKINTYPETRSVRDIQELEDEMTNWQQYVNSEDIEYLDQNGCPKVILDEIFRGIRRNNKFYGVLDGNFRDERMTPENGPRQNYREMVQKYVEVLKACVATPEDPGETFFEQFREGEPPDYSMFDEWKKRKAEIDASRAKYYL